MAGTAERVLAVKLIGDVSSINKSMKGVTGRFKSMKHDAASWTKAFALTKVIDGIGDVTDALGDAWSGFRSGQKVAGQLGNTWKNLGLDGSKLASTLQAVTDSTLRLGTSDDEAVAAFNNSIKRTKDYNESLKELGIAQDLVASGSAPNLEAAFKMIQQASKGSARVVDKFGLTSDTAAGRVDELGKRVHGAAKKAAELNPMGRIMNSIQESAEGFVGALSQGNLQGALDALAQIGTTLKTAIFGRDKLVKDPVGNAIGVKHIDGLADTIKKAAQGLAGSIDLSGLLTFDNLAGMFRTAIQLVQTNKDVLATIGIAALALGAAFSAAMFVASAFATVFSAVFSAPAFIASKVLLAAIALAGGILGSAFSGAMFTAKMLAGGITEAMAAIAVSGSLLSVLTSVGLSVGGAILVGILASISVQKILDAISNALRGAAKDAGLDNNLPLGPGDLPWKHRAGGGPVGGSAGGSFIVGEHGPELLRMGAQRGHITSANGNWGGGGSGDSVTINLYGIAADEASVGKALDKALSAFYSRSGRVTARR